MMPECLRLYDRAARVLDMMHLVASNREPGGELVRLPPPDVIEEDFRTYFYITKKGVGRLLSGKTGWPFGDNGNRRG